MKSFKSVIWLVIFLWIFGVGFGVFAIPSLMTSLSEPVPLDSVDFDGDIEGLYVKGTIWGIYDYYCEETKNYDTVAREYIIDAGNSYYMGMRAERSDMTAADKLMDASWNYLDGYTDYEDLEKYQYEVTGTITKIPSDSLSYYYDFRNYVSEGDAELKAAFLPYYLDVNKAGKFDKTGAIILSIAAVGFFLWGCLLLYWIFSGHYQKSIQKYIQNSSSPDMAAEKVERFFQSVPEVKGLRYNNEFICGQEGGTTAFGETSKLVWVYLHTVTHKRYFVTISKSYSLMLGFIDGTRQSVTMKSEVIAQGQIQDLGNKFPHIICGYSKELDNMFCHKRPEFLNLRYNEAMRNAEQI